MNPKDRPWLFAWLCLTAGTAFIAAQAGALYVVDSLVENPLPVLRSAAVITVTLVTMGILALGFAAPNSSSPDRFPEGD